MILLWIITVLVIATIDVKDVKEKRKLLEECWNLDLNPCATNSCINDKGLENLITIEDRISCLEYIEYERHLETKNGR